MKPYPIHQRRCAFCHERFETHVPWAIYCSEDHRKAALENMRRHYGMSETAKTPGTAE